ncbi:MAG: M1 family metallopeptidase [Myxococcales bacterium]|nr:M1 family metallopeptidase [Myxococcales bacterium]
MRIDPHSWASSSQPRTTSLDWKATVDFGTRVLRGEVTLHLASAAPADGPLDLDTRELTIDAVTGSDGPLPFTLHEADPILGSRLEVQLPAGETQVRVRYRTSPSASALQWLAPKMTLGGKQPYLFSQCQAIHARSVLPCQDTPAFRVTYQAELMVPARLRAVMAAQHLGREERDDVAFERFSMPQPIPPYLFAFAVGELASKDLSPRTRVWTEPGQLDAAAWEFAGVEAMMEAAERLFGPYDWERFDLLVMPPSFPYGGMENPRLTFLTPALLAGDRSLVNVVAHELAHSWTGNLVTNANAEHFWLNEGFTVWAERHILEALEGPQLAGLHAAIGFKELQGAFQRFEKRPQLTRLRTQLSGVDPDEAFSLVPYEKGYLFLKTLEAAAGKERFEAMLKRWLHERRFGVATTDDFLAHVEAQLPGVLAQARAAEWVDAPGLPDNHPTPRSTRLDAVTALVGKVPEPAQVAHWTPAEWQLFLDAFPRPASAEVCRTLDERFTLAHAKNPEVKVAFLTLACESGLGQPYAGPVEEVVSHLGRMKYLRPLYQALAGHPETKAGAKALFEKCRAGYHPIAQHVIAQLLAKA